MLFVTDSVELLQQILTREALEVLGDFRIRGQVIHTVIHTDNPVLLAKAEAVLQGMIEKLVEIGRCYRMEMSVEKTKVMRFSREPSPIQIVIDQKQPENVEYFNYLGRRITNDA